VLGISDLEFNRGFAAFRLHYRKKK
jgi:hypothetical protein